MKSCPYCHATTRQSKAGKNEAGLQRYRCLHCSQTYVLEPKNESNGVFNASEPALNTDNHIPIALAPLVAANPARDLNPVMVSTEGRAVAPADTAFPAREKKGFLARLLDWGGATNSWGWLPEIALLQSAGLLFLAWNFSEARASAGSPDVLLWVGLAALILPVAYRLAAAQPARRERIALVLLLGMSLYLVKVMHSPNAFTFPDELSHMRNVGEILRTHHLFQENPVQPVTAFYPGLPTVTSTLVSMSGLSTFPAGILVIAAARLMLFLALFLLYEQVSGSARVAGLGVLFYMANPNFLYWTAEYAYEPLALPFLIFVLLAVAKREAAEDRRGRIAWTVVALSGLLMVVITHHMSSYILTALLVVLVIFYAIRFRGKQWGPWDLALVALVATSLWLVFIANLTIEYLAPVLLGAVQSIFHLIVQEEQSRELFKSGSTGRVAPLWEQVIGIGSVILIASGLPFGVYETWDKYRSRIFALLLAAIALVYLPMQMLRFSKASWETANRSSEFLFIGIGYVLALGIVTFWFTKWPGWKSQAVLAVLAVTLFFGGFIAGWPPRARLPRAYVVAVGSHLVKPQIVSVAEWLRANLGTDHRIAASKADAKVLGAYDQYPFTDTARSIRTMFFSESVGDSEKTTLSKRNIEYVMADRKLISWDHMIGYYFYNQERGSSTELKMVDLGVFEKFNGLVGVNRMLDAGDIVLYDVANYLATNNPDSKTASVKSQNPPLYVPVPGLNDRQLPAPFTQDSSVTSGGVRPMLSSGNERGSGTNQVYSRMPVRMSICGIQSIDRHDNPFLRLKVSIEKLIRSECRDGRLP